MARENKLGMESQRRVAAGPHRSYEDCGPTDTPKTCVAVRQSVVQDAFRGLANDIERAHERIRELRSLVHAVSYPAGPMPPVPERDATGVLVADDLINLSTQVQQMIYELEDAIERLAV